MKKCMRLLALFLIVLISLQGNFVYASNEDSEPLEQTEEDTRNFLDLQAEKSSLPSSEEELTRQSSEQNTDIRIMEPSVQESTVLPTEEITEGMTESEEKQLPQLFAARNTENIIDESAVSAKITTALKDEQDLFNSADPIRFDNHYLKIHIDYNVANNGIVEEGTKLQIELSPEDKNSFLKYPYTYSRTSRL